MEAETTIGSECDDRENWLTLDLAAGESAHAQVLEQRLFVALVAEQSAGLLGTVFVSPSLRLGVGNVLQKGVARLERAGGVAHEKGHRVHVVRRGTGAFEPGGRGKRNEQQEKLEIGIICETPQRLRGM